MSTYRMPAACDPSPPMSSLHSCGLLFCSVFDHQIMLKGFAFIGNIPEHIVKQAHLQVSYQSLHRYPCPCLHLAPMHAWLLCTNMLIQCDGMGTDRTLMQHSCTG